MYRNDINSSAVGARTRRLLADCVVRGELDEPCAALLERGLAKARGHAHGGLVFCLAQSLGASAEVALEAASAAEIINGAIDITDDVQDGDSSAYLGDLPVAIHINLVVHLLTVGMLAITRLEQTHGGARPAGLTGACCRLLSGMACGQRVELLRENWSPSAYKRMSHLTGGCQYELYFRVASWAAGKEVDALLPLAPPLGLLVQMAVDEASRDGRLLGLPGSEMAVVKQEALRELGDAVERIPTACRLALDPWFQQAGLGRQ